VDHDSINGDIEGLLIDRERSGDIRMGCPPSKSAKVSHWPRPARARDAEPKPAAGQTWFSFGEFFATNKRCELSGYVFEKEIGKGSISHVYLARHIESGNNVAVKVYNLPQLCKPSLGPEEPLFESVRREISLMDSVSHRYVLEIYEAITSNETNSLLIVMPFARLGTLQSLLDSNSIAQDAFPICFLQVAVAFQCLHERHIVHRDLKPDNILCFEANYFVLCDFSVSAQLDGPGVKLDDTRGSPAFLSPEECSGHAYDPKAADVWAYGITLFRSIFSHLPFNLESAHGRAVLPTIILVKELLETEELVLPDLPDGADPEVLPLIRATLDKDVERRPTFDDIVKFNYFRDAWPIDQTFEEAFRERRARFEEEEDMRDAGT
jgi:serine/threonine protein kinase